MIDFSRIVCETSAYNFHSHTRWCDGKGELDEYVDEALRLGYCHYGFSPHSPIAIDSPCNMSVGDVDEYLAEVDALRHKYGNCISLYAGMEIDYLSPEHGPANEYFRSLPLDYRIGSVHFLPADDGRYYDIDGPFERFRRYVDTVWHGDIRHVVELFYRQSSEMLLLGGFDILGHLDKIAGNAAQYQPDIETRSWYRKVLDGYVDGVIESGVAVEVNTKATETLRRIYPAPRVISRLRASGVTMPVNSDSHHPSRISLGRDAALALLS